jgi:hypothetical protein
VVIGGRAFGRSSDYRQLAERFRSGDLEDLQSDETFQNVIFADESDLDHACVASDPGGKQILNKPSQTLPAVGNKPGGAAGSSSYQRSRAGTNSRRTRSRDRGTIIGSTACLRNESR